MASGVRENFGTSTKSVHIGKTAGDGVLAAQMASHGITSSPSALEGHEGYLREYAGFDGVTFGDYAHRWMRAGAKAVGGCCRTVDSHIREVAKAREIYLKLGR